jgi:hypothetical protein
LVDIVIGVGAAGVVVVAADVGLTGDAPPPHETDAATRRISQQQFLVGDTRMLASVNTSL